LETLTNTGLSPILVRGGLVRQIFLITVTLSLLQVSVASAGVHFSEADGNILPTSNQNSDDTAQTEEQTKNFNMIQALQDCTSEGGVFDRATNKCNPRSAPATQQSTASPSPQTSACVADTEDAVKQCNFSDSKDAQLAVGMANQMVQQLKAMTVANQALLCSKMGAASQALDVAVGAFSTYCTQAYSKCESSCAKEIEEIKERIDASFVAFAVPALEEQKAMLVKKSKACSSLSSNVKNIFQSVGSYAAMETAKSQYCSEKTDALAELCKSQPGNVLCKTNGGANCSDPNVAATSIVCICQKKPNDPRCGAQAAIGLNSGLPNANGANSASGSNGSDKPGDFGGLGGGADSGPGGFNSNAMNDGSGNGGFNPRSGVGGRGGGLGGGGGGGGQNGKGGGAGAGGGAGGNGINAKIISGYGVGGTGGPAGRYGGAGVGGPNGNGMGGRNGYMAANGKPGVDLRKFMPGGQMDPSRGLAGVSGPDGMTGPNSDIWKKINMRYFSVTPSLLP
jgi:hypothetical protein